MARKRDQRRGAPMGLVLGTDVSYAPWSERESEALREAIGGQASDDWFTDFAGEFSAIVGRALELEIMSSRQPTQREVAVAMEQIATTAQDLINLVSPSDDDRVFVTSARNTASFQLMLLMALDWPGLQDKLKLLKSTSSNAARDLKINASARTKRAPHAYIEMFSDIFRILQAYDIDYKLPSNDAIDTVEGRPYYKVSMLAVNAIKGRLLAIDDSSDYDSSRALNLAEHFSSLGGKAFAAHLRSGASKARDRFLLGSKRQLETSDHSERHYPGPRSAGFLPLKPKE